MAGWSRSLRSLMVVAALLVSVAVTLAVYLATEAVFTQAVQRAGVQNAKVLADGTFNAMYQIMRQGWTREQLNEFLDSLNRQDDSGAVINVYRGSQVDQLFGRIEQPAPDDTAMAAFDTRETHVRTDQDLVRYDRPLVANAQCLQCHTNARAGSGPETFSYLRRFAFDFIKIEAEWLCDHKVSQRDRAFIDGLLTIAETLGVAVIAHNIETDSQLELVRGLAIELAQGYRFAGEVEALPVGRPSCSSEAD